MTLRDLKKLLPKEHGASVQLLAPIASIAWAGEPGAAFFGLSAAFALAFLIHEPTMIAVGYRGPRLHKELGKHATHLVLVLSAISAGVGGFGFWAASSASRVLLLAPFALALVLAVLIARKRERSAFGEGLVAVTLSSLALPLAASASIELIPTLEIFGVWAVGFVGAVSSVRATIAAAKGRAEPSARWVVGLSCLAAIALFTLASSFAWCAPLLAMAVILLVVKPSARALYRVGFALFGASVVTLVGIGATF